MPTVTLPKSNVVGVRVSWPGAVPVPERETVKVEFEAFEVMVMPPVAVVVDCGANTALKVTLAPGLSVSGTFSPLMLNPDPVTVACEIVTLAPPLFVSESVKVRLLPAWTLPKARLAGLAVIWPGRTAFPDKARFIVELEALEVKAMLPLTLPAVCGPKITEKVALWPAPSVSGKVRPLRAKLALVRVACETVTLAPPVFVSASTKVMLVPTWMLPNARLAGLAVS